uniref:RNA-directed DNA polymerase n=1 Tax=Schizaphis graminum TaxID=13262 RepID=A0A2S2NRW3_SCHGA
MFRPWEDTEIQPKIGEIPDRQKSLEPVNLRAVLLYLLGHGYPNDIHHKNDKSNFRRQAKSFYVDNDTLYHKKHSARVILDHEERMNILKMVHEGSHESEEAVALSSHRGRDATLHILNQRYYWPSMTLDTKKYIKECNICQRVNPATLKVMPELHPVPVPKMVFKQIGIDLITLPEVNGYRYAAVAIDYFSKWCEARPLSDKRATTVAHFIYDEIICRHGCPKIEISDQGREFCNSICDELFKLTGTIHKVTSPYHPQANGLVERFNRTIKNYLLKIHNENKIEWPNVLQGVLFAYRSVPHSSTKYSPFFVLYQREPVLPVDLKHSLSEDHSIIEDNFTGEFDEEKFKNTLECMISMRDLIQDNVSENIKNAQDLQKTSYAKRHPRADSIFKVGDKVLLKNLRRDDRKGGWALMPWIGPYSIHKIINNNLCVLKNGDKILKTKHLIKNIKQYYERNSSETIPMDVEYVQTLSMQNETRYFNPVGKHWQQAKCRALKLDLKKSLDETDFKIKMLNHPCETKNIIGDGNCLFRAFSFIVTGTEEQHLIIRQNIASIVNTNQKILKYVGGEKQLQSYLKENKIENEGM